MAIFYLPPQRQKIYALLIEIAGIMCEASISIKKYISDSILPDRHLNVLYAMKKRGDRALDLVWKETIRQFVLPFDPEDIIILADYLNRSVEMTVLIAQKASFYHVFIREEKELLAMITILESAAREIYQMTASLSKLKTNRKQVANKCKTIKTYREQCQLNYLQGTARLYSQGKLLTSQVLIRKEVYVAAAEAIDCCYEVSLIVREMTIKYV